MVLPEENCKISRSDPGGDNPPHEPSLPPEVLALFPERDPGAIQRGVFDALCDDLGLTLPRTFEGRHFRLLNFDRVPIRDIMDLRGTEHRGFYLTELRKHGVDLVYGCQGVRIEWCADECVLQLGLGSEAVGFDASALLGLVQGSNSDFIFVGEPAYREWIRPYEPLCALTSARFMTLAEWAGCRAETTLIWPLA